ncbi:MAG: hypothetical protein GXO87_01615 [Chlorobi bacterium]|nr:hypothetical protein [Chlorobiota bacterium]
MERIILPIENELKNIVEQIPEKYRATVLEYAKTIKMKADKGELSDTEYLENIPGMAESIIREFKIDKSKYSDKLDW